MDEAEALRQQLTLDVQSIQAQLGDKQRTDEAGNRLDSREYWAWKKRASHALTLKLNELRAVKAWIREHRKEISPPVTGAETVAHLRNLMTIISAARADEVDFEPYELSQIEAAELHLYRLGVPNPTAIREEDDQCPPPTDESSD